jgi:AcrR family transcriptional regulator
MVDAGTRTDAQEPVADTQKRRQILDGATRVFLMQGFNGASMEQIARISGVSKGTLYVYFQNKEQLFEACVEEKRRIFREQVLEFDISRPVDEELRRFGLGFARFVTEPQVIMAMRTVIGIAEQMPELGARFYDNGPAHGARVFSDYLTIKADEGHLALPDAQLAAVQFIDLCQSTLVRPRLFGVDLSGAERERRILKVVDAAVEMFLARYRAR